MLFCGLSFHVGFCFQADTLFEGKKYNKIRYSKFGTLLFLGNEYKDGDLFKLTGPAVYFYENRIKQKEGNLENGMLNGFWIYYYPNGKKEKEGYYFIRKTIRLVGRPPAPNEYHTESAPDSIWKYWDIDGNEIEKEIYQAIQKASYLEANIKLLKEEENTQTWNQAKARKLSYLEDYRKKYFPENSSVEKPIYIQQKNPGQTKQALLDFQAIELNSTTRIVFKGLKYKMYATVSGDTLFLDGEVPLDSSCSIYIESGTGKAMESKQFFETSIVLRAGSNHFTLNRFKHGFTNGQNFIPEENGKIQFKVPFPIGNLPFPNVGLEELKLEAAFSSGEFFRDEIKKMKGPNDPPAKVEVTGQYLEMKMSDGKKITLILRWPMGC